MALGCSLTTSRPNFDFIRQKQVEVRLNREEALRVLEEEFGINPLETRSIKLQRIIIN
jgi:hypothetical protein